MLGQDHRDDLIAEKRSYAATNSDHDKDDGEITHQDLGQGDRDVKRVGDKKPRVKTERNAKGELVLVRSRKDGKRGSWWNIFHNF